MINQSIHSGIQTQVGRGKGNYDLLIIFEENNSSWYSSGILYICTMHTNIDYVIVS